MTSDRAGHGRPDKQDRGGNGAEKRPRDTVAPAAAPSPASHGDKQRQGDGDAATVVRTTDFTPADEELPLWIARLPDEILMLIVTFVATPRGKRGTAITRTVPTTHATSEHSTRNTASAATKQAPEEDSHDHDEQVADIGSSLSNLAINSAATEGRLNEPAHDGKDATASAPVRGQHSRTIGVGMVLGGADFVSIDRLAKSSWKFYTMTKEWAIWKKIVQETYLTPQIPPSLSLPALVKQHGNDWRMTFIKQPRVRMNGAYIAAYHYRRSVPHPDNVWVRVDHEVKFFRTLRFFPDGQVVSLLTTDPPNETLKRMEPLLNVKGSAVGRWTVHAQGLLDDEAFLRSPGPKVVVEDLHGKTLPGYTFRLVLSLHMRKGKWDRMEILEYESLNLKTGEICPFPIQHEMPFYFSVVRSYGI